MESAKLKRRGTIAEEAAVGLIEAKKEIIEEMNKNKKKTFKENLKELKKEIYDSERRQFLSRDAKAWYKLSLFYGLFYTGLAGFFLICLYGFYFTVDFKTPTYYNKESVMHFKQVNPGLGFRPHVDPESDLISIKPNKSLAVYMDAFLEKYDEGKNINFTGASKAPITFDIDSIIGNTPCSKSNQYGLNSTSPCIAVKLNRIYGWVPIYERKKVPLNFTKPSDDKFVYILCNGESGVDKDNIKKIEYYSSFPSKEIGGINFKYFPYRNQQNYLSPLVFVHFKEISLNTLISVECKAYAKNIDNDDRLNKRGMVKFQLFVGN